MVWESGYADIRVLGMLGITGCLYCIVCVCCSMVVLWHYGCRVLQCCWYYGLNVLVNSGIMVVCSYGIMGLWLV